MSSGNPRQNPYLSVPIGALLPRTALPIIVVMSVGAATRTKVPAAKPGVRVMANAKPSIAQAKTQAKALRAKLAEEGHAISHAKALELIARQYGARDWNTFHAQLGNAEQPPFAPGARVTGRYLSQAFAGEIVAARKLSNGFYRLELHFDEPVDVVRFESFSNFRRRISADVSADGVSPARTSDGAPHLIID